MIRHKFAYVKEFNVSKNDYMTNDSLWSSVVDTVSRQLTGEDKYNFDDELSSSKSGSEDQYKVLKKYARKAGIKLTTYDEDYNSGKYSGGTNSSSNDSEGGYNSNVQSPETKKLRDDLTEISRNSYFSTPHTRDEYNTIGSNIQYQLKQKGIDINNISSSELDNLTANNDHTMREIIEDIQKGKDFSMLDKYDGENPGGGYNSITSKQDLANLSDDDLKGIAQDIKNTYEGAYNSRFVNDVQELLNKRSINFSKSHNYAYTKQFSLSSIDKEFAEALDKLIKEYKDKGATNIRSILDYAKLTEANLRRSKLVESNIKR